VFSVCHENTGASASPGGETLCLLITKQKEEEEEKKRFSV
jgi:hypothetical protein